MRRDQVWLATVGCVFSLGVASAAFAQGALPSAPMPANPDSATTTSTDAATPAVSSTRATPGSFGADSLPGDSGSTLPHSAASARGMRAGGRGAANPSGQSLFAADSATPSSGRHAYGDASSFGSTDTPGSFDWTKFFTDASQTTFRLTAPRLFSMNGQGEGLSSGGMRPMGGASMFDLGAGLFHSMGDASSVALGSSFNMLADISDMQRRGLNLSLNDLDKSSNLGLRLSFKDMIGRNSLLGGSSFSGNSFGGVSGFGNSFGSDFGSGLGSGFGAPSGKRGGSGSSQVSLQLKF